MIRTLLFSAALTALALSTAANAETIAITGASVWTGTNDAPIEEGVVIIEDNQIAAVGPSTLAVPEGATVIDATGQWVTPGIFSAFSRTGLVEVSLEVSTNDTAAEMTVYSTSLDALDGFNPSATTVPVTRLQGVTRIAVAPSAINSPFAGQGLIADTSGSEDSVTTPQAFQFIVLGEGGATVSGGSRPGAWAKLRAAFDDASSFTRRYLTTSEGGALNRADAEALIPAVEGDQLMLIQVHRASDIRRVIDLKSENPDFNIAIVGATEGWLVADELAAVDIPVIIEPYDNLPARFETLGATGRNAARLIEAGVRTAFAHLDSDSHQARLVLQSAGNAVSQGVSQADAMEAITARPAEIFGLEGYGRLASGAVADVVIWDGDPLEVTSAPTAVYIAGEAQPMESRQTKLRDR
ncbi:MAG: amidohydrolase family protein, partial [Pseudomonadota bacterium]